MRGVWLALAAGLVVASCDDVNVHILSGNQYDEAAGCVTASQAIDVAEGPSNGDNCSPQCLVSSGNEQTYVYVTTVCPPYPGDYTSEPLDAAEDSADPCFGALAAYEQYADAMVACSVSTTDGGTDGPDGGADGTADAPVDATTETGGDGGGD
jgi:hypothetical protein